MSGRQAAPGGAGGEKASSLSRGEFLKLGGLGIAGASLLVAPRTAGAQSSSYIDQRHHAGGHFSRGRQTGVAVRNGTLRLSNPRRSGDRYVGTLVSPAVSTSIGFDTLLPSWEARTPPGTWVVMLVRVRSGGSWSGWMSLGPWAGTTRDVNRRSVSTTHPSWRVDVDTVVSRSGGRAQAYQYALRLFSGSQRASPVVRRASVSVSDAARHSEAATGVPIRSAAGRDLRVPARSQYAHENGGEVWCSPVSLNMVLGYWGNRTGRDAWRQPVLRTVRGTRDFGANIWGNWPFNTAYAGHLGLRSSVRRFRSLNEIERWVDAGVPVVASVAWDNRYASRTLSNAPISWSYGHLLVVRGFRRNGDVIVNDPAGANGSQVPRVYGRSQFARAWLANDSWTSNRSSGVVYVVHPVNWRTP
ncbi:MAG: peptidase C39 family protein [Rubrobacter sp.]|nr:peptidase C39 family protein [Rubrobacter sp.]